MLVYHVYLAARKMDQGDPFYGNAVNIAGRYWREYGWHLCNFAGGPQDAGFAAWIKGILRVDPFGDNEEGLSWAYTKAFRDEFGDEPDLDHADSVGEAVYSMLNVMIAGL